jgi:hypothetical protein
MTLFYSAAAQGFFDNRLHKELPPDAVEISQDQHAELLEGQSAGMVIVPSADGKPVLADPPPPPAPTVVSMRQARLALLDIGLLNQVDAAISSLPSPQKEEAQIEWEYATEIWRDSPTMIMLGSALGLSEVQIDALFMAASAK